jgi:phosphinothricin acetyltransferase
MSTVDVRLARLDDAEAIRRIYNVEVETSTVTFDLVPRTVDEQRRWIEARSGAHAVVVAERDGEVVGFGSLSPWRDRPAYSTSVEDSVYIDRGHQGEGIGKVLLAELLRVARLHGFHAVFARIVGGHASSVGLHRSLGFEVVGVEKQVGRKFRTWLDVTVMEVLLADADPESEAGVGADGERAGAQAARPG